MPELPEFFAVPWFRKAYEDATFDCLMEKIRDVLAENAKRKRSLLKTRRGKSEADKLICQVAHLARAISIAHKNVFTKSSPVYKLTLIAYVLEMKPEQFISPVDKILTRMLVTLVDDFQLKVARHEICKAVAEFVEAPYQIQGVEAIFKQITEAWKREENPHQ